MLSVLLKMAEKCFRLYNAHEDFLCYSCGHDMSNLLVKTFPYIENVATCGFISVETSRAGYNTSGSSSMSEFSLCCILYSVIKLKTGGHGIVFSL